MSPEWVDRLIILDFIRIENDQMIGSKCYIDPPVNQELRVRWAYGRLPEGFVSVAGDLAFVSTEKREKENVYIEDPNEYCMEDFGNSRYQLSEGLKRGLSKLMVILILPESYTLTDPSPGHHGIRDFNGRVALYWVLGADELQRTNVEWTIERFDKKKENIGSVIKSINAKHHANYVSLLPEPSTKIFISYRRAESPAMTDRIYERLVKVFGKKAVFRDIHSIDVGDDFRKLIEEQILKCRVMLVVIGDKWLHAKDALGNRRLDDEDDFLRIEVESALQLGLPLVPLLVEGMTMPSAKDLPSSIRDLAYRNAAEIRHDPDFHTDMDRLVENLKKHLKKMK
jgi:hypothetical protein